MLGDGLFNWLSQCVFRRLAMLLVSLGVMQPLQAYCLEKPEQTLETEVGIFTKLGTKVDLSQEFTNIKGDRRALKDFALPGKPIVIAPVYYKCPRLCGLLLDGAYNLFNDLPLQLAKDYSVLVVGFDPSESPEDAAKIKSKFDQRLNGSALSGAGAIQYLVGAPSQTANLMSELGFKFVKDGKDFAHSAALMILTPTGEISQYFTGIMFAPWDVRLSLVEASKGVIGTAVDHLLLYCFRFDPLQGKYTWAVVGLLRIGGALTLVGLGLVYFLFARKKRLVNGSTLSGERKFESVAG